MEQNAAATCDKETKENTIEKTTKDQDVKYKTKEAAGIIGMLEVIESDFTKGRDECKDQYLSIQSTVKDLSWEIEKNEAEMDLNLRKH